MLLAICVIVGNARAGEAIPILGVSLGGQFPQIKICTASQSRSDKTMCWKERPTAFPGGKYGEINLPGSDSRPTWAANADFQATVGANGNLDALTVKTFSSRDPLEIVKSIESRFGQTTRETSSFGKISAASWDKPSVAIQMICSYTNGCSVVFTSIEANLANKAEIARRKAKDATRPTAP